MNRQHADVLVEIAHQAMIDKGLEPDFSAEVQQQLDTIHGPAKEHDNAAIRDLRELAWCSIDNDDSRDLDQLTYADKVKNGDTRIFIAVADVDALVKKGTPIDEHARTNTTSVYTAARIFPMLPEKLSTDLTSLNEAEERIAVVIEMVVRDDGNVGQGDVYRARVLNKAKLAYDRVAAWLDGEQDEPDGVRNVKGLAETL
ncbi:MAG TPA: RNB domain-containing ribonuclease, partial [Thermoanaerobaculia bacterium]|nr:RNB domain-containing ribonuclease [Thermoanaerobaculia bacterium]